MRITICASPKEIQVKRQNMTTVRNIFKLIKYKYMNLIEFLDQFSNESSCKSNFLKGRLAIDGWLARNVIIMDTIGYKTKFNFNLEVIY